MEFNKMGRRLIYQGKIVGLDIEKVETPSGHTFDLEIVRHPGGAAAVVLDDEGRVCLLDQFRYVCAERILELPAGMLEPGEPPLETARRETLEEAGVTAAEWVSLGSMLSSPGIFTEVVHLFFAQQIVAKGKTDHEPEELIEVLWVPFEEAISWCDSGRIRDAKTLIGLYRAKAMLRGKD